MDTKIFKTQTLTSRSPQLRVYSAHRQLCRMCEMSKGGIQKNNRVSEDREALLVGWSGKASWKK